MPDQRDDAWLQKATADEIDQAFRAGELSGLLGVPINDRGNPVDSSGRVINH